VGKATDRLQEAQRLVGRSRARLANVSGKTRNLAPRPRVFCLERIDPVYCGGHWMAEIVELAGGVDALARRGTDSIRVPWDEILRWAPEVLIASPCGLHLDKVLEQAERLFGYPGWEDLPAVRENRVYAVDANSYFARPGPRIVEGVELLAHLIWPDLFSWAGADRGFVKVDALNARRGVQPSP
jgi:iron complex transport system substrate-binding protein